MESEQNVLGQQTQTATMEQDEKQRKDLYSFRSGNLVVQVVFNVCDVPVYSRWWCQCPTLYSVIACQLPVNRGSDCGRVEGQLRAIA